VRLMSNDNIIEFPEKGGDPVSNEDAALEILECDNCANKTWQVGINGVIICPICNNDFDLKAYLNEE